MFEYIDSEHLVLLDHVPGKTPSPSYFTGFLAP